MTGLAGPLVLLSTTTGSAGSELSEIKSQSMQGYRDLLGTDFDSRPTDDIDDVIYGASESPHHRTRVPGLVDDIRDVIGRGVRSLAAGENFLVDLATQLVDWRAGCPQSTGSWPWSWP
ncbi:hypothetical protein [Streptomyces sp. NPDC058674]|uniref:hypothetical protein n=1 Tax=Streptomyces sp. NPDC058674 TaxID=3346592 RepID=UPI0036688BF7